MQTLDDEHPVLDLSVEECWALLRTQEFGRVAFRLVDEVHITPINYLVDRGRLVVRTGSGNKLLAAALSSDAALEIDWIDETTAWSVVVRGRFHRLSESEQAEIDDSRLHSWVPTLKYEMLALLPSEVTGRRFLLQR
jgi:nitroimidazol reductase NimA-like FMN-containing flavoprotein (pyridoxamine 5'-phosphate oxidase superfamily)